MIMKVSKLIPLVCVMVMIACNNKTPKKSVKNKHVDYDAELAVQYGADDYGMKQYVMALLWKGPNRALPPNETATLQEAHLNNINRLAEEGVLVLAGPFLQSDSLKGIYIFDVTGLEEAERLTATDPAIEAGYLTMELKSWYGSAALLALGDIHNKLQKKGITGN